MLQENLALSLTIEHWHAYQQLLTRAIAPLTTDQLALRIGSQRSAGELAAHIINVRAWYLHGVMGEGGAEMEAFGGWEAAPPASAELLVGIDQTWVLLNDCLQRWTVAQMHDQFYMDWLGRDVSRAWLIWHLLEHEIHHGGELSFTLGSFGLAGVDV